MEANLSNDKLKYFSFKGYSLYILPKSRQMVSGLLVGVKTGLTADFRIIKDMDCSPDKNEVIKLNLWKNGKRFNILAIYSPPNNKPDFSYLNSSTRTVLMGDFNAHSPIWGYIDSNNAGKSVEDLLNSNIFELFYNHSDPHTYLHYNVTSTSPDLLLVTSDISEYSRRYVIVNPGSGHHFGARASSHSILNSSLSLEELTQPITCLKSGKSSGEDGVHSEFLQHLSTCALSTLLRFFNLIWNSGTILSQWLRAIVLPIHKKDKDPKDLQSYRPISLTSILGETKERIVTKRLSWFLETNSLLPEEQAGFRQFRSTNQQITFLSQSIKDALDKSRILSAVFIDLKSAYDTVGTDKLLLKLANIGIENIFNWFRGFLCQRLCKIRYGRGFSKYGVLKPGLPQGSVSSCTLFSIYINDLVHQQNDYWS
ncbi:reverse transcriptase domain-containing protein [Trichonephila inaurata madagascariensis]|uniref:Reverse transcriptase domain-containing protein n=1 Tax=Trichonephila inaurata madagascariensis TaxID=2747483 RepID=A0A8X7CPY0_9ARAC|nr:reverse transcriptase domain-containing protein [Trichonephila inaurata madagascariensis]